MTREEAIQILSTRDAHGVPCGYTSGYQEAYDMAIEALKQEPKRGEWKYYNYSDINNPYVGLYECTVCKQHEHIKHNFCPNCGADMRGEK